MAAGVYTIWDGDEFAYVGIAGRKITAATSRTGKRSGLWTRLQSHASGRRSGDQFCVYVSDRLVLPTLSREQILAVSAGSLLLDHLVRDYVRANLAFRFIDVTDGRHALEIELRVRRGALRAGRPLLNPLEK